MKRNVIVLLVMALLVLPFSSAFAAGGAPPQFGITTDGIKLGDIRSHNWRNGYHGLIVDGTNVYTVRVYGERVGNSFFEKEVIMDKSNDGGLTWVGSSGIARGSEIHNDGSGIAIDPVTKALHYVWAYNDPPTYSGVYYGNGSITTRVNGLVNYESDSATIAVDGSSVIHIVFYDGFSSYYYTASSDNGLTFSEPTAIPVATGYWYSFTADSAGNLYLVYDNGRYFMKKLAGGSWSNPYSACPTCPGNDPSMAVYDSNRIYFAQEGKIAATSNGGQTWIIYDAPNVATGGLGSLAISSDGLLNYAWEGADGVYFARTTKSHDPSSWGQVVLAIPRAGAVSFMLPNVAVDSAGKAYIMAEKHYMEGSNLYSIAVFTKEK